MSTLLGQLLLPSDLSTASLPCRTSCLCGSTAQLNLTQPKMVERPKWVKRLLSFFRSHHRKSLTERPPRLPSTVASSVGIPYTSAVTDSWLCVRSSNSLDSFTNSSINQTSPHSAQRSESFSQTTLNSGQRPTSFSQTTLNSVPASFSEISLHSVQRSFYAPPKLTLRGFGKRPDDGTIVVFLKSVHRHGDDHMAEVLYSAEMPSFQPCCDDATYEKYHMRVYNPAEGE